MPTRQRRRSRTADEQYDDDFGLVTDEDIVAFMAEQEIEEETEAKTKEGFWNLQTASGMGLIGLGALYSLQQIGLFPLGSPILAELAQILPVFAAILIMLTGFGVLSWSPAARRRKKARKRAARLRRQQRKTMGRRTRPDEAGRRAASAFEQAEKVLRSAGRTASRATSRATSDAFKRRSRARSAGYKRLAKDRENRKMSGVAAGMANYFGLDPTIVRIGWVVATIFSQGVALIPYIVLSMILPNEADLDDDDDPIVRISDD